MTHVNCVIPSHVCLISSKTLEVARDGIAVRTTDGNEAPMALNYSYFHRARCAPRATRTALIERQNQAIVLVRAPTALTSIVDV